MLYAISRTSDSRKEEIIVSAIIFVLCAVYTLLGVLLLIGLGRSARKGDAVRFATQQPTPARRRKRPGVGAQVTPARR
jgi:hypothetical protein